MLLVCDRCGAGIPPGARFCPSCADPVTQADLVSAKPVLAAERVQLVCPRCRSQATYAVAGDGSAALICPTCGQRFETRVVRIRSKNSRGSRKTNTRAFSVRANDLAARDVFFEFQSYGWDDFELRSRDLAAFSYVDGRLRVVQNLTLGRYLTLPAPNVGFGIGCVIALLVLLAVFVALCSSFNSTPATSGGGGAQPAPTYTSGEGSASAETLYLHGELNLRSAPKRDGSLVRRLERGERVRLGPQDANGWAPAYDEGGALEGYVYRASGLASPTPPAVADVAPSPASKKTATRRSGAASRGYYVGPRGGCYTYSASGRKRYVDHSYCY